MKNCSTCKHFDVIAMECAIDRNGETFFYTFEDATDCVEKGVWRELSKSELI